MKKTKSKIDSRELRKKLKPSGKPYLEALETGFDFGYRKGQRGGSWVMRRYLDRDRGYTYETFGRADDDPAETSTLAYHAARLLARERMQAITEGARREGLGPAVTVKSAIEAYADVRDAREIARQGGDDAKGIKRDARLRLAKHVPEALATKPLADVTADDLATWRAGLNVRSAQRAVNDFRAALNAAAKRHGAKLPATIRNTIKDGLATVNASAPVAREAQVLPVADIRRINAAAQDVDREGDWGGDLERLVVTLAATGARFSQIIRMTVADVQTIRKTVDGAEEVQHRLMIPASRKGRATVARPPYAIPVGDDVLAALAPATAGRKGFETLFLRPRWRQVGPAKWEKGERGRWFAAAELTRPWEKIVAKAGLSAATVPYALRHSSIVRGLRAGLPTRLVASAHDTSIGMIERHYAAFVTDAMADLMVRAIVPLTTAPATPMRSIA